MNEKKETSYELLLQQQKVFLQWQMDNGQTSVNGSKQKMILPAPSSSYQGGTSISSEAYKLKCAKLEDMKVSDLKVELKKRNLPVSGSKPQLIERLKPFSDEIASLKPETAPSLEGVQLANNTISNNISGNAMALSNDSAAEDGSIGGEQDSVMAKMDILHKELLEKQRIQTLFQQQQHQQSGSNQQSGTTQHSNVITIADGSGPDQAIQVNRVLCQPGVQIIHAKSQLVTLQVAKSSDATHANGGMLNMSGLTGPQNIAIVSQVASSSGGLAATGLQKMSPQHIQVKQVQHVVPTSQPGATVGSPHVVSQLGKSLSQLQPIQIQQNGAVQVKQVNAPKQTVQTGKVQPVHIKAISGQHLQQAGANQPKTSTLPKQLLQHKVLLQPASIVASSLGTTPMSAGPASPALKSFSIERKGSLSQDGSRSHTRTHSLPGDMDKLFRKPPDYSESSPKHRQPPQPRSPGRESCEVNLNDIFEIITKQDQPAQFEVTRNPDTGVVTLKEATADTPKTSHIVTPNIKEPLVIEGLTLPVSLGENVAGAQHKTAQDHVGATPMASLPDGARTGQGLAKAAKAETDLPPARTAEEGGHNAQSFKGLPHVLAKSEPSIQNVLGATESPSLDVEKAEVSARTHEEKALDFNVDLDALETLDINFDIINQDNNNKQQNQHPFKTLALEPDQMSTDFQDLDWWSNELFETKQQNPEDITAAGQSNGGQRCASPLMTPISSQASLINGGPVGTTSSDNLRTPEIIPTLSLNDPLLSFSNAHSCGMADHKATNGIHHHHHHHHHHNNNNSLLGSGTTQPLTHHPPAISLYSDMQGLLCEDVVMADWTSPQPHSFDIHMQM
ncbi:hypothetical protein BIW11_01834 [Tropilaelaps mercedesae]|uniref:SAP domain-containing protein n=1 Tax=Tropilaelaps mercedesae TaxID=418985 RepID=A0A1V9X7K4_9ACAR|nr:hypothetical protein BIW11_01834 [Tropilaelaps mercedesae]